MRLFGRPCSTDRVYGSIRLGFRARDLDSQHERGAALYRTHGRRVVAARTIRAIAVTVIAQARIERPELTQRLAAGLDSGSVVVLAGAGFGKPTAIEDARRGARR